MSLSSVNTFGSEVAFVSGTTQDMIYAHGSSNPNTNSYTASVNQHSAGGYAEKAGINLFASSSVNAGSGSTTSTSSSTATTTTTSSSSASATPTSDLVFCSTDSVLCFYSHPHNSTHMHFMLQATKTVGWAGIGFGSSMSSAEVYVKLSVRDCIIIYVQSNSIPPIISSSSQIAWTNSDGSITLSRRRSAGYSQPAPVANQKYATILANATALNSGGSGGFNVTFIRPMGSANSFAEEVYFTQGQTQSLIFAYGTSNPSSSDPAASISQHSASSLGEVSNANLFLSNGQSSNAMIGVGGGAGGAAYAYNIAVHGVLMFLAWIVFAPTGIIVARYFKGKLGVWWFRLHIAIMFGGSCGLNIISFILVYTAAGITPTSSQPLVRQVHGVLGIMISSITMAQVVSGYVIDRLYSPSRTAIPIRDKMHWWVGRILFVASIINVPIGMMTYSVYVQETPTSY